MNTILSIVLGAALMLVLVAAWARYFGFRGQRIDDFDGTTPVLDPRSRLTGPMLCEGVLYGPTGQVATRFVADMNARWDDDGGVIDEYFRYDSGTTQTRQWRLQLGPDGAVTGEADDIIGQARGRQVGSALVLEYRIRLPESAGAHVLDVTDWMYLGENGTIVNRSQFRKFGIRVAELVATIRPDPEAARQAA